MNVDYFLKENNKMTLLKKRKIKNEAIEDEDTHTA